MDIGYAGALLGGVLTLFSPCSVMLLPAFFAYAFASPTKLLQRTGIFYLGLLMTLVPLGLLAGALGSLLTQNRGVLVSVAAGIVILIGLLQLIGVNIPGLNRGAVGEGTSAISVFILGAVYGVAGVCAGPILGSVLTVAATGANPVYGGIMLAIFALGMALPLGLLALVWTRFRVGERGWLRPRRVRIGRWENSIWMIVSGVLSIGIGVLLLVTEGTASLGGIFTVGTQYRAESWAAETAGQVPNVTFVLVAVAMLVIVGALVFWRSRRNRAAAAEAAEVAA
ncbi:cytochrome c biogenesis protein CcdA [Mycetocola tolaasinivorans]|uniref:Cytochrome c biogenesis protein CcdA n=1 Tax=Mycetocola tolaasinivorans TaxID=76635 RepID=A0A3L7ACK8_9MICO|nr:cytochrome c biogenesis CcdA family protein [Mycetocola tolaasinivorans]RLP77468.1 cytochrome c biogenesis protein CcdA [Mycetocola tolaasinivorans]